MNAGVKSTVDSVRAVETELTAVTITAYEQSKGRVSATTLFKFLNQPDKLSALQMRLQCKKIFPLVTSSKADREKFLNTPPGGFDPNLWRQVSNLKYSINILHFQGVRSNPDPERFLPQPIYGFDKVAERKRMQVNSKAAHATILNEYVERLKKIEGDVSRFKSHLQNNKRQNRELFHR